MKFALNVTELSNYVDLCFFRYYESKLRAKPMYLMTYFAYSGHILQI